MVSRKPVPSAPARPRSSPPKTSRRPLLRPMVRVERISLFEKEVRERLSRSALDLVFAAAEVMAEGQRTAKAGRDTFFGSTMLTIDLARVAPDVRDACDARAAQRLAALLADEPAAQARAKAMAARETERVAGSRPKVITTEIKVRARGTTVYVDIDVEASF